MGRTIVVALLVSLGSVAAQAQDARESWKLGATAAAGFPANLGAIRVSAPLGLHGGVDFEVARLTNAGSHDLGPAYVTHARWIRGGRTPSGNSRYWIFGVLGMKAQTSTLVIFPGNVRKYLVEDHTLVMPRLGYGWDHITRRGTRAGVELTTGAAGEEMGLLLANVFVMWGPPRK